MSTDPKSIGLMMYQGSYDPRPEFFGSKDSGWFFVNVLPGYSYSGPMKDQAAVVLNQFMAEPNVSSRFIPADELYAILIPQDAPIMKPFIISALRISDFASISSFYVFAHTGTQAVALATEIIDWGHGAAGYKITAKESNSAYHAINKMFDNFADLKKREIEEGAVTE